MAKKKIVKDMTKFENSFTDCEFYITDMERINNTLKGRVKCYHDTDAYNNNEEALTSKIEGVDISTTGVSTELDAVITAYENLEDKFLDYLLTTPDYTGGVKE